MSFKPKAFTTRLIVSKRCAELGKKPDQPFKGTFNVRISPELHRKAVLASSDNSLNAFVSDAIQEKLMRLGA